MKRLAVGLHIGLLRLIVRIRTCGDNNKVCCKVGGLHRHRVAYGQMGLPDELSLSLSLELEESDDIGSDSGLASTFCFLATFCFFFVVGTEGSAAHAAA